MAQQDELQVGAEVEQAIAEAKQAAQKAGLATGRTTDDDDDQVQVQGWTSFALELEGLTSASQVPAIEKTLTSIPGVRAHVVYPTATAWISTPDHVDPNRLIEALAEQGVTAWLTRSSLRRRAERLEVSARRTRLTRQRLAQWRRRNHALHQSRSAAVGGNDVTREQGYLRPDVRVLPKEKEPTDVLFTARALITTTRLLVSLVLTVPVLVLTHVQDLQFDYWQWVCLALATPVVVWGAWPFHRAAVAGIRRGMSALDAASSVAIIAAYVWSIVLLTLTPAGEKGWTSAPKWFAFDHSAFAVGELFLDVACGCTVLLLVGRLVTRISSTSLLDQDQWPPVDAHATYMVVRRETNAQVAKPAAVPVQELRVGDDVIVPAGEIIPADGKVIGGSATIEPGRYGGPAAPMTVKVNAPVTAGCTVADGELKIRVSATGSRTRIAAIRRWLEESSRYGNRSAQLATRSASLLVPWALSIAVVDFVFWWLIGGNLNSAFATALAVLCCVGPVALALSTSIALRLGIESGVRRGLLIRDAETIRELNEVDTVIFNRVGTLAAGHMGIETITVNDGEDADLVLAVAGALAIDSTHPASQAIVKAARAARDKRANGADYVVDVQETHFDDAGNFVGRIILPTSDDSHEVKKPVDARLWRPRDLAEVEGKLATATVSGGTPLIVSWQGQPRGVITLLDKLKDDSQDAIEALESAGYETIMLSRDTYPVARRFADNLGMSHVLAGIAPDKKSSAVRSVHAAGQTVAFVGDESVLDCLKVADVGIFMGATNTIDVVEADVVLLRQDPTAVTELMVLSRRVSSVVDKNIGISWVYNGVAIAASVAGILHPMAATVAMIASSLIIEVHSNRVRGF